MGMNDEKRKNALTIRCPTCGAKPKEQCELNTGQPRNEPHRDRRIIGKRKQLEVSS